MRIFNFTAVDKTGRRVQGQLEADSRQDALDQLSKAGQYPIDIEAIEPRRSGWHRSPSPSSITLLTRELSLLLAAGQTLGAALATLQEDEAAPRTHALVGRLRQAIASGKSFAEALALEAAIFPPIYVGMVKAAEMSGALTEVLGQIADARESEQRLKGKILSALLYPTLLVCTAIGVVVFLLAFVVPAFKDALGEQSAQLSVATAAVLAASDWLVAYGDWMLIAIAVLLAACLLLGRLPSVRSFWGRVSLRIPLAGPLLRMAITVRFCRTFGALLSSGLGVAPALTLTRDVIGNEEAKALLDRLGAAIRDGVDFTEPLKTSHVFPPLVASLLRVGDQGGALADVSVRLANMYETKLELGLQRAMSILEPAVILLVSILIGTIVLSIVNSLLGIYDLAGP